MTPIILSSNPDCPVLDNGLVRVRYDPGTGYTGGVGTPGFRVDAWTGSAYAEQGKMLFFRNGDSANWDDTWIAAGLHTDQGYTPDRAVVSAVLTQSGDPNSREQIFVTMQRGEPGVTFECYPALKNAGTPAGAALAWFPALNAGAADLNASIVKIDSQGTGNWTPGAAASPQTPGPAPGKIIASAGAGGGPGNGGLMLTNTVLGNSDFATSENWVALLRCPTAYNTIGPYQTNFAVIQAANASCRTVNDSAAYGVTDNNINIPNGVNAPGYVSCRVRFAPTQVQQIIEAETMTMGTNWTAGAGGPTASGSQSASTSQTTDTGFISTASWPNGFLGVYRVFARVLVTAASTLNIYAKTGATTGTTVTSTTTTYHWVDLGEIVANNTALEIHAWSTGGGLLRVDRLEAVLVEDRTRSGAIFSGARDVGQAALIDARTMGAVVSR